MKVLMVSEDVPQRGMGGLGRHALTLARALARMGHEVDFMGNNLVPCEEIPRDTTLPGRFFSDLDMRNIGWKEVRMGIFNPLRRPFIAWRFARAIRRRAVDYDVVHYHGHFPLLANHIPRRINFVQTRHDQGSDCLTHTRFRNHDVCRETSPFSCAACATPNPTAVQRWLSAGAVGLYRWLTARAFLRHKTIFVSDMLRRNFARTAGEGPWGSVIHNFVDCSALQTRAMAGKPTSKLVEVFIAGKLYEPKGISAFLAEMHGRVPPWMRVVIAGNGENEGELRGNYGSEQIVLLGWQSYAETVQRMAAADVVVVPSLCEESCATVILEGLALGKRVLALARGGTPELIKFQRYPGQLSLFGGIGELVEGLVLLESKEATFQAPESGFPGDVLAVCHDIVRMYTANCAGRSLQCH